MITKRGEFLTGMFAASAGDVIADGIFRSDEELGLGGRVAEGGGLIFVGFG